MLNSKVLLVAKRELTENIRTKTFWLGILLFPVILTASIVIPSFLEKRKSVRAYAVIDGSGWLLEEIERRADMPDLERVLRVTLERMREDPDGFAALPDTLQQTAKQLEAGVDMLRGMPQLPAEMRDLDDEGLEDHVVKGFATIVTQLDRPEGEQFRNMMPPQALSAILDQRAAIRDWWQSLPPDEAKDFGSTINKSRYRAVEIDDLGLRGDALITELNRQIADKELFAYFVIHDDPVADSEGSRYVSANLTDTDLRDWFGALATEAVRERRLAKAEIAPETARHIQAPLDFESRKIAAGGAEEDVSAEDTLRQWAPVVFVYLLWFSVFMVAQMLLTNTIEEKSNRIMEVLLSSVSPLQLMSGKILGIAATGLTMVLSWIFFFYLVVTYLPGWMGIEMNLDLASIASDPIFMTSFIVYFLLGYLLYAALLVGIGAVCNSLKEAQNLMSPVTIMMMIPLFAMVPIGKDPNGALAQALSYIPTFTPFVMMNRAAGPPSTMEYVLTTAILLVSVALAMWGAAKVFRVGILMTGKAPTPREILRWLRAPVGQMPVVRD